MTIAPHEFFEIVRPDTVAECWDGVLAADDLYEALWGCVGSYEAPSPEESEEPCHGMDSVADFWDRFTPAQQEALNALAEAQEAYEDDYQPDEIQEWHDFDPDC